MEEIEIPDTDTTCSICFAEFLDPEDLAVHLTQVHSSEVQPTLKSCQFCPKYLSGLEEYAIHIRNDHIMSLKCCKYCNRFFKDFDEYRTHESKHYTYVAKSMYSCSQCQKLFNNMSELELHEHKEHFNDIDGVFLNDCLPILSSILNIKALKFLHTLGDSVVYTCVRCEMSTRNPKDYLEHLKITDCRSLVCDGCSSVYRNKKGLARHIETHQECVSGGKQVYKQCKECYKMFSKKLWRDHTKNCKAIKCKMCHVVFSSMYDLSRHQTQEHPSTVTLESCKFCHKEFAGSLCLNKHVERAHKHEIHLYKYKCIYCYAIYKHPKKLFAHFYSTHKDLEPYTCTICDKKFKIRKKFTIHIKLDHKSIGYIEFDKNYHVFFSDKKSEKPEVSGDQNLATRNEKEIKEDIDIKDIKTENIKKVQFVVEKKEIIKDDVEATYLNVNSDFMSATETEGNQTELDEKPKLKRKLQPKLGVMKRIKKSNVEIVISDSSDDEPLMELKKRVKMNRRNKLRNATWNSKRRKDINDNKKRFICNICKKNCYTFQNYHNHVALHYKNVTLKCVKCSDTFTSKEALNKHYSKKHSSSKLTQTLRNLLEKRKNGVQKDSTVSTTEKFQRTIRKVHIPKDKVSATLTELKNKLSVQKFIENFTPEDAPKKKTVEIDSSVTMKPIHGPYKSPAIKLTKCNLQHMDFSKTSLSMPVRFRQVIGETNKVTVREIQLNEVPIEIEDRNYAYETYYEDGNIDRNESIPDVAQEVMLEITEEPAPKAVYIPHRVVLPKLPKEYNKIRIAHLQSEAPYYKIVKVEDVLNPQAKEKAKPKPVEAPDTKMDIKLPDGTKLVTVNPLAHLLGDTPVEKILENSKNKYYQPKAKDFEVAIAKAMLRLEKPEAFPKKKRKKAD